MPADEGHAHHGLDRHLADEADGLERHDLPDRDVRVEELGVRGGDDDVGVGDPVEPAAGAQAVDGRDDRLPDLLVPRREVEVELLDRPSVALHANTVARDLGHVDAGLEGAALARVHDHLHLGIAVELGPCHRELVAHTGRHRIELVGAVVDQPADRPAPLELQALELRIRHAVVLSCGSRGCQTGSRFSANARGPSSWSGWPHMSTSSCAPQRLLGGSHRGGRVARDLRGELLPGIAQRVRRVDDLGQDAELSCTRGIDALVRAGQRHAHDRLHRGLADEPDRLVRAHLPERDVGIDERRVRRCQDDVGVGDEVEPASGADAVHGRDHRLPDLVVPCREPELGVSRPARLLAQRLLVATEVHDVDPGLERAPVACVHDHPDLRVVVQLAPRGLELAEHRGVHRVAGVGPVEDQPSHGAAPLDKEGRAVLNCGHYRAVFAGCQNQVVEIGWK